MNRLKFSLFGLFVLLLSFPLLVSADDTARKRLNNIPSADTVYEEYYVRYERDTEKAVANIIAQQGGIIRYTFPAVRAYAVSLPAGQRAALSSHPEISFTEPVPEYKMLENVSAESIRSTTISLVPTAQTVPWNIDQAQARDIWDVDRDGVVDANAPDGSGIKICVIDSGFHGTHEDFAGITVSGMSQISGENWNEDGNGHGTHVAGTINAMSNNTGVVGMLPGAAELIIVKIFNNDGVWEFGQSNLGNAATYCADQGADIINMSLGGGFSSTENAIFQSLYDSNNMLSIAAAGNDANDDASYPASYDSVISVAALDINEAHADFSQYPPTNDDPNNPPANVEWDVVELAAGGADVYSTWPTVNTFNASVSGTTYIGNHIAETPYGTQTATLVDGGLCESGTGGAGWNDMVVLCERGNVAFSEKVNEVEANGGLAAIIFNNAAGNFSGTCDGSCTGGIPAISLSQADGQALRDNELGNSITVESAVGTGDNGYFAISGTSMATPGVAGATALVWATCNGPAGNDNGALTNKQLRQLLRDAAKDLTSGPGGAVGYDPATGFGLIQIKDAADLGDTRHSDICQSVAVLSAAPQSIDSCQDAPSDAIFNLSLSLPATGSTSLSLTGEPSGASAVFTPNPIASGNSTSSLTVGNLSGVATGSYTLDITADDSGADTSNTTVTLNVLAGAPALTTLGAPVDGAVNLSVAPTLTWNTTAEATSYLIEIATDPNFGNVVLSDSSATTSYAATGLSTNTAYYWRVQATNGCGDGTWSAMSAFVTEAGDGEPVCGDVIVDGGFENGPNTAWSESSTNSDIIVDSSYPDTGTYSAWMGGLANEDAQIWQAVNVPANAISAELTFRGWIDSGELFSCTNDVAYVFADDTEILSGGLCLSTDTGGFVDQSPVAVPAGTTELRFQTTTNGFTNSSFLVDNVALNVCVPGATETEADFSDLPSSYGPAWHEGDGVLHIGAVWSADTSFETAQDDADSDDGTTFADLTPETATSVDVTVSGTLSGANGWVGIWCDWDDNGAFDDGTAFTGAVNIGSNSLSVTAPSEVTAEQVACRVRLYDSATEPARAPLSPTGLALTGEVEDSMVTVAPTTPTAVQLSGLTTHVDQRVLIVLATLLTITVAFAWVRRREDAL